MKLDPPPLILPNSYGPLVAVLTGFHCIGAREKSFVLLEFYCNTLFDLRTYSNINILASNRLPEVKKAIKKFKSATLQVVLVS